MLLNTPQLLLLQKPRFSCRFLLQFCASLVLPVQSLCANSIKQAWQSTSLSLLAPLPIPPSPTYWPVFPLSLSLSVNFFISVPTNIPLAFVSGLLAVNSFIFSHPSPPTFPSPSDVLLGRLSLCVVVIHTRKAMNKPSIFKHTHARTHEGRAPEARGAHERGNWAPGLYKAIQGFLDHRSCQNMHACERARTFKWLPWQDWLMWQSAWSEALINMTGDQQQSTNVRRCICITWSHTPTERKAAVTQQFRQVITQIAMVGFQQKH